MSAADGLVGLLRWTVQVVSIIFPMMNELYEHTLHPSLDNIKRMNNQSGHRAGRKTGDRLDESRGEARIAGFDHMKKGRENTGSGYVRLCYMIPNVCILGISGPVHAPVAV